MEPLKLEAPESVSWSYDKEADVLYISFGEPRKSLTLDLGEGLLARYLKDTGEVTGFTTVGISYMTKQRE
ncbi:MAG TPA: DUF2283 domain-containing protein [Dehalococcoidia bacterium]|nr:DUF2283 domain-containing protein [Dehalococcoidia bacterium]